MADYFYSFTALLWSAAQTCRVGEVAQWECAVADEENQ